MPKKWWRKLIAILLAVGILARLAYILGHSLFGATRLASVLTTVVGAGVGATAFVLMLWWTALLEEAEWDALPKGRQIYQFINRGRK